jgi:hypothetical protein
VPAVKLGAWVEQNRPDVPARIDGAAWERWRVADLDAGARGALIVLLLDEIARLECLRRRDQAALAKRTRWPGVWPVVAVGLGVVAGVEFVMLVIEWGLK